MPQRELEQAWPHLQFGAVEVQRNDDRWCIQVPVDLGAIDPVFVRVELYADPWEGHDAVCQPMLRWHIQILPRVTTIAGFELGSGIYITTVVPEASAAFMGDIIARRRPGRP
jgi:hypothetical protein